MEWTFPIIIIIISLTVLLLLIIIICSGDKKSENNTKELTSLEIYEVLLDVKKMIETENNYYEAYENALDLNALSATENKEIVKDIIEGQKEWDDTMLLLNFIYEQLKHKEENFLRKHYSGKKIEIEEIEEQGKINSLLQEILLVKKQIISLQKEAVRLIKEGGKVI